MNRLAKFFALTFTLLCCPTLFADGERDNNPLKVRRIPKLGIELNAEERKSLTVGLEKLKAKLDQIKSTSPSQKELADIEIFYRAVNDNLKYQEFFSKADVKKAHAVLEKGIARADSILKGEQPWREATGLVVRGFRSELDDTVQPYGLVIPKNYQPGGEKKFRLDIWFHGRGETLSETNFIDQRSKNAGYYQPADTIVLHPYGRYSNAFKFAGEVDVLEALAHVKQNYRIDEYRISVRGFSMGGAGCWQFAALYSDQWFAANPGAGFSETPEFLKFFQKEKLLPYPWEQRLWGWYDADDSAANFYNLPLIAYSGENDIQKQAADLMEKALAKQGIRMTHIIGPKTGHRIHPDSQEEIERRMNSLASRGRNRFPLDIRKTTHSLKYNRHYWLTIDQLSEHWTPSTVRAKIEGNLITLQSSGINGFTFRFPSGYAPFKKTEPVTLNIKGQTIKLPSPESDQSWTASVYRIGSHWKVGKYKPNRLVKKHGLQGPIDDAFMSSFLMVTPSGQPLNQTSGDWTKQEQQHAITHWRQHFRGHARVKLDTEVTEDDIARHNLILWGDPSSNALLKKILPKIPLDWDRDSVTIGRNQFDSSKHIPILIYPNPLNPEKYIVINSGFTFREYAYLNNARQVPMLPDWAIVDVVTKPTPRNSIYRFPGIPVAADFFDENWMATQRIK